MRASKSPVRSSAYNRRTRRSKITKSANRRKPRQIPPHLKKHCSKNLQFSPPRTIRIATKDMKAKICGLHDMDNNGRSTGFCAKIRKKIETAAPPSVHKRLAARQNQPLMRKHKRLIITSGERQVPESDRHGSNPRNLCAGPQDGHWSAEYSATRRRDPRAPAPRSLPVFSGFRDAAR